MKIKKEFKITEPENVPPRLENYQAMYKEQRPTERKSVRPSENVLTVLVLQQEQHEEFFNT